MKELRVEMQPRDGGLVITTHYPKEDDGIGSIFDWLVGDHVDAAGDATSSPCRAR